MWAYNSGINPQATTGNTTGCTPGPNCTDANGYYGLGWTNNPARPEYPFNRAPFLDGNNYDDARNPQRWPCPEKVIGWAAYPIVKYTGGDGYEAGYQQAWWTSVGARTAAKPGVDKFCTPSDKTGNRCNPNNVGGATNPCLQADFHCWWHSPVSWKNCDTGQDVCGHEADVITAPGTPEPPDADAVGAYTDEQRNRFRPNCSLNGLPNGTLVVDNLPLVVNGAPVSAPPLRAGCTPPTSNGTFGLSFAQHTDGLFHSKVDCRRYSSTRSPSSSNGATPRGRCGPRPWTSCWAAREARCSSRSSTAPPPHSSPGGSTRPSPR